MVTWDWYYTVAGVVAAEVAYLMARYMYGDPQMRRRVYEQIWAYILAWLAIAGVVAVYENRHAITNAILGAFGLPAPQSVSVSYIDWLIGQEITSWGIYWVGYIILKAIGSSKFPVLAGIGSGLADFLKEWTFLQLQAYQWFMADLAILAVLTMYYEYFNKYGLFAVTASLIIPRSTRPIGASLTAYYLILAVMLPVFYGIVIYEMPYTEPVPIYFPCNPFQAGLANLGPCILQDIINASNAYFINNILISPYNAYIAFVWDALLDIAYVLSWLFAYWAARLIDAGAFRLLEVVT